MIRLYSNDKHEDTELGVSLVSTRVVFVILSLIFSGV